MYDIVVHNVFKLVKEVIVDTLIIEEDRPLDSGKFSVTVEQGVGPSTLARMLVKKGLRTL
jgi:hypothetical protein